MGWLEQAGALGRAALATAIVLWFLRGLRGQMTIRLSHRRLARFHVGRHVAYRALKKLEAVGLVRLQRHPGRCPVVALVVQEPRS